MIRRLALLAAMVTLFAGQAQAQQPRTSGSITAGGADCSVAARCVAMQVGSAGGAAAITASGFGSATVQIEVSIDATSSNTGTWTAQPEAYNLATGTTGSSFTANGTYIVPLKGAQWVRARASTYSSGTIAIAVGATAAAVSFAPNTAQPVSGTVTVTQGTASNLKVDLSGTAANGTAIKTDGSAVTQPISASSLPLPTGAATSANQTNRTQTTQITDGAGNARSANVTAANALVVDGSAVTQPISAASLPLPTNAATSTKQSDGTQKTQIVDGSGNVIASTSNNLNVQCANCSGSGVSTGDEATFTAGSSLFAGSGGFFQTTATNNALTTGQQGAFQVTANRALFTNLRNAAGTEMGTSSNPLQVTGANGSFPISGNLTGNQAVNVAQINGVTPLMGNGVTGTGSQRVTIASDNTAFSVNAIQSGTWTVQPGNTANTTAWLVAGGKTNNNAAPGATNLGALVALANTSAPTYTDGNEVLLSTDTSGGLRVNCVTGCGGGTGGTAMADRAAFTYGTTQFTPVGGVYNSSITALTSGQAGAAALTPTRDVHVSLYDASGNALLGSKTSANSIPVVIASDQGAVAVTATGSGTFTVAGGKTNNNAAPGATNVGALVALANAAAPSWTEGNLVLGSVDLHGSQRVTQLDSGGTSATDTTAHAVKTLAVDATGAAVTPTTLATHDAALTPASTTGGVILARAFSGTPSDVSANDDAALVLSDLKGRLRMVCDSGCSGTTLGQSNKANSLPVTLAYDQGQIAVNENQINGWPVAIGLGPSTVGTQRVAISRDSRVMVEPGTLALTANAQGRVTTTAPLYTDSTTMPLSLDANGALRVNVTSGSSGNAAASATGSAVPAQADYSGVNIGGTLRGVTGLSVGSQFAPTVAIVDASGNQITSFGGSGGTASNFGSAFPSTGTAAGFTDGSNMQGARVVDLDTGAGTVYGLIGNLVRRASGGPVELIGQATMANSLPVAIASDQGALTVSGTVTANIGTTNGLALDASVTGLQVAQGSTTSGQKGDLVLGAVTTNAPTYTTGQTSPLSLDTAGLARVSLKDTPSNTNNLNVNLAASAATVTVTGTVTTTPPSNASTNVAQFGGTNVSTGTGAGGAGIPRVTISNDSSLAANQSTNVNQIGGTNVVTGGVAGLIAVAGNVANAGTATANPVPIGGVFTTTPTTLSTGQTATAQFTSAQRLIVDGSQVTQPVSGTVTANIGTTNGLALDASVTGLQVAQGSTTSGQKGDLILGAVTTNAPTYSTGQTSPISLDLSGLVRVSLKDTPQNTNALKVDGSAVTQPTFLNGAALVAGVSLSAVTGNSTGTDITLSGQSVIQFTVNCASCSGGTTVNFQQSDDSGANWTAAQAWQVGSSATLASSTTTAGRTFWQIPAGYFHDFRATVTNYSAGTVTVNIGSSAVGTLGQFSVLDSTAHVDMIGNGGYDTTLQQILRALLQQGTPKTAAAIKGSFGRTITSTGDALDVNVKYQAATLDPCASAAKMNVAISQTASARLAAGVPGQRIYLCSVVVVGADAENIAFVEGTGSTCGTGTAAVIGGTTAANGPNLAANGGFANGNGQGSIANTASMGTDLCLLQSGGGRVAGNAMVTFR